MFLADPSLTGQVAEIHGDGTGAEDGGGGSGGVTIRPPHEFVDEASERNIEAFWGLGYACSLLFVSILVSNLLLLVKEF